MKLRRILLFGGTGRLGSAVCRATGENMTVALTAPHRGEMDLFTVTDEDLDACLGSGLYDVVLNCAAEALVDRCEVERQAATRINAVVPGMLAEACARAEVPFVHISTDYVFGGPAAPEGPFTESDIAGPAQFYGETKSAGEKAVLSAVGRRTVARVSWLFGPNASPFADYVLAQARDRGEVPVLDQASRPTWLPGLARWCVDLCSALSDGAFTPHILHPAGGPAATRVEWARAILDAQGLQDIPVVPQEATKAPLAPRPRDTRLDTARTDSWCRATWISGIPDWREALRNSPEE